MDVGNSPMKFDKRCVLKKKSSPYVISFYSAWKFCFTLSDNIKF